MSTMSINQQIRTHLQHGQGTRRVKINPQGEVHMIGSPDELDRSGWRFRGYVNAILKEIDQTQLSSALDAQEMDIIDELLAPTPTTKSQAAR